MIQFLRICKPLDDPEVWKRYVPIPKREKGKAPPDPDPKVAQILRVSAVKICIYPPVPR